MADNTLTKFQKNEIYELIQEYNLPLNNFRWGTKSFDIGGISSDYSVLNYDDSFYFEFERDEHNQFTIKYKPGYQYLIFHDNADGWSALLAHFDNWLEYLEKDLEEPDFWEELDKFRPSTEMIAIEDVKNEKFSYEEIERLKQSFEKITEKLISEFKPDSEKEKHIRRQIDYLVESAKNQRIRDWQNICIGVFINMAMNLAISPDKISKYWQIINDGLTTIRHLLGV